MSPAKAIVTGPESSPVSPRPPARSCGGCAVRGAAASGVPGAVGLSPARTSVAGLSPVGVLPAGVSVAGLRVAGPRVEGLCVAGLLAPVAGVGSVYTEGPPPQDSPADERRTIRAESDR